MSSGAARAAAAALQVACGLAILPVGLLSAWQGFVGDGAGGVLVGGLLQFFSLYLVLDGAVPRAWPDPG